jgi:hypothetical protein
VEQDLFVDPYGRSYVVIQDRTVGLAPRDSLIQIPASGNRLKWIAGHLMAGRSNPPTPLGTTTVWSRADAERYPPGSPPILDGAGALPFERIMTDFDRSPDALLAALRALSPGAIERAAGDTILGAELLRYGLHEAYHAGQLKLLRSLAGK